MDGETTETATGESGDFDARAAFIAGELGDDDKAASKGEDKTSTDADDDSDLDEDQERDEADADSDAGDEDESDAEEDEDADLDEDDEKDKADEKDVDAETSKRLSQVRRTDQRLRERREADFAKREADLDARATQLEEQLKPHREKLEKYEKAVARAAIDPAGVLLALGVPEDRYEHVAQVIYTLAKAKDDPKARAAAASLMKERERDAEIERLKAKDEEREQREQERERTTVADRQLDAYFGKVVKAANEKTPLAAAFIKGDPTEAREVMQVLTFRLAKQTGSLPKERDVIIALEKDRRGILRKLGIDPKTVSAKKATAAIASETKAAPKKGDKKPAKPTAKADDELPLTKEAFIKGNLH